MFNLDQKSPSNNVTTVTDLPQPIRKGIYHCGKTFVLERLLDMFQACVHTSVQRVGYAFAYVSGHLLELYSYHDGHLQHLAKMETKLQKKQKKGGSSAARFGRLRLENRHKWVTKISACLDQHLMDSNGRASVQGLILGGPSTMKNEVFRMQHSHLITALRGKIHLVTIQDCFAGTIRSQLEQVFCSTWVAEERRTWSSFTDDMKQDLCMYGSTEVKSGLANFELQKIIVKIPGPCDIGLDEWDEACAAASATMVVLTYTGACLDDYGGVVGIRWH